MNRQWYSIMQYWIMAWALLVGGCTMYWSHPVKNDLEWAHDVAYCEALGGAAAHGMMSDKYWLIFVDVAREVTKQRVLERCMERRGWTKTAAEVQHRPCSISDRAVGVTERSGC
jgi:hypothetical protein